MADVATILILTGLFGGYAAEGVKYNNSDKDPHVNYVYDPAYYTLDESAPFPEKCCSRCAVK